MKDNNNIPEPEVFTSKIEETIDDLFKPVKNIEIDPLTQEVKEVGQERPQTQEPEIELELAIEESPEEQGTKGETEEKVQSKQEDKAAEKAADQEPEPEVELELIEEEEELEVQIDPSAKATPEDDVAARLERLREDIYTIEWEVSGQELSEISAEIGSILKLPEIHSNEEIANLLQLSEQVVEKGEKAPQKMAATAPHLLKRAIEAVISFYSTGNLDKDEALTIEKELKELLGQEMVSEAEPSASHEKGEDLRLKQEPRVSEPQVAAQSTKTAEALSKEGEKVLIAHIQQLQREVNRILPLERLLYKTPGMEKLYKFHKGLRTSLEREITILSEFFFTGLDLELPKPDEMAAKKEDYASEIKAEGCPWKQLLTLSIEDMEIGIPADQVAYIGEPPWLSKSHIKKADRLSLSKLKPWPWSKLSGRFLNELAEMDEKELAGLELPVIKRLDGTELRVPSNFFVIVLYRGEKGAVLRAPERPISINVPQNAKCRLSDSGSFAGEVEVNGNKIKVLTVDSIGR